MKKIKMRSAGMSMMEIVIAMGLLSFVAMTIVSAFKSHRQFHSQNTLAISLWNYRNTILQAIASQISWDNTVQGNFSMKCISTFPSSCPAGYFQTINILGDRKQVIVNSANPVAGIDESLQPCSSFPSANCPIRAVASWEVTCTNSQDCKNPQEYINIEFHYATNAKLNNPTIGSSKFNVIAFNRRTLSENSSPVVICARNQRVFVGINKTITSGLGASTLSDTDGCVPLSAFQGARGPNGPRGPAGIQGPPGPPGPSYSESCVGNFGHQCLAQETSWIDTACMTYRDVWCHDIITRADVGFKVIDRGKVENLRCKPGEGDEHAVTCYRYEYGRVTCDGRCVK